MKLWVERRPPFGDRDGFVLIINGSPNKAQIHIYMAEYDRFGDKLGKKRFTQYKHESISIYSKPISPTGHHLYHILQHV